MKQKKKSTKIGKPALKGNIFKEYKIRECHVNLTRLTVQNSTLFRKALFEKHQIRDCVVKLCRLDEESIPKVSTEFSLTPTGTIQSNSNISWFPGSSTVRKNSIDARSSLAVYQKENHVVKKTVGKKTSKAKPTEMPKQHQGTKSVFKKWGRESSTVGQMKQWITMEDMHNDIAEKFRSPNRGLKPVEQRELAAPMPKPKTDFEKLFDEFNAKLQAKNSEK